MLLVLGQDDPFLSNGLVATVQTKARVGSSSSARANETKLCARIASLRERSLVGQDPPCQLHGLQLRPEQPRLLSALVLPQWLGGFEHVSLVAELQKVLGWGHRFGSSSV